MKVRDYIESVAESCDTSSILLSEEFDSSIIGIQYKDDFVLTVYSELKVLDCLMENMDCDRTSALEYFEYNIENAYLGAGSPVFIDDTFIGVLN